MPETEVCKHLDFQLFPDDEMGWCTCLVCGTHLRVFDAFNNLQKAVFDQFLELKRVIELFTPKEPKT